ncbi:MAG TPA: tRNA isopentenyl-2-thiomethyl-A-37 hydroxylase MiaE [Pontiella sp.]
MELVNQADLDALLEFLPCATPRAWIEEALRQEEVLLLNHCYLEQCAARNALRLMFRCPDKPDLLCRMSKLAREELRHFEKVLELLTARGYTYKMLKPSRYAGRLHGAARTEEPGGLVDTLIIGAYIEARSCERFAALVPYVDDELAAFSGRCSSPRHVISGTICCWQRHTAIARSTEGSPFSVKSSGMPLNHRMNSFAFTAVCRHSSVSATGQKTQSLRCGVSFFT